MQSAIFAFYYSVTVRSEKAEENAVFIFSNRKLRLVPVSVYRGRRNYILTPDIRSAYSCKLFVDKIFLYFKLVFILYMSENTSSALREQTTDIFSLYL